MSSRPQIPDTRPLVNLHTLENSLEISKLLQEGLALHNEGKIDEARFIYEQILERQSNHFNALQLLATTYAQQENFEIALGYFEIALLINNTNAAVFNNKGNVLKELKRFDEALHSYDQALSIKPDYDDAYFNKGGVLKELKRFDEALHSYDHALSIKPDYDFLLGTRQQTSMFLCQWNNLQENVDNLRKSIESNLPSSAPFPILGLIDDPDIQKRCASTFIKYKYPAKNKNYIRDSKVKGEKLKIGYFSADFYNHATLHLMLEVFKNHDHSQFDFFAFSFAPQKNDMWRQEVQKYFKDFIDVGNLKDKQIAELSRKLGIDIAIDLKGFTQDARTGIFANRAAPIQINYLGYPGTMGAEYMDYIIADQVLIPEDSQRFYSEKVLYLPNCYQPNIHIRKISEKIILRKDVGLPENSTVYCSFNNIFKYTPEMFSAWLDVLGQVENSVLWILSTNYTANNNLIQYAKERGIDCSRFIFAPHIPIEEHLKRLPLADVFLDTFPCNAHTTASDSVRMGVPIVTLCGQSFASRVAASILTAVNMTDLITNNLDDFKRLSIKLGTDKEYLQKIKNRLSQSIPQSPLFDSTGFTKDLEAIYSSLNNS